ncbi:MAG TPA: hypothetical protein ENN69_02950, partial [Spirochaetia bacterium]|nr:hypothetical protein [Spirochaetia bacterium]
MTRSARFFLSASLSLLTGPLAAQDISLHGNVEQYGLALCGSLFKERLYGAASTLVRLTLSAAPADWLDVDAAWALSADVIPESLPPESVFSPTLIPNDYRVIDPPRRLLPTSGGGIENLTVNQALSRLSVTVYLPCMDVILGRQAIACRPRITSMHGRHTVTAKRESAW